LSVTTVGSFMVLLDATIVNVALPSIIRDFHSSVNRGQLVLTIYLLALAAVVPLSGFLGERVGMKRLYMVTLVGFTLSSALCALAWNMPSLILFRALQGIGGGMLQPLGMAIIFTMITPLERGRFMVMLGLPMLLGPILGPTVGGYLVQYLSWRTIFLINVPIGVIDIVLAQALLNETAIRHESRLDVKGLAFALVAFPGLLLGLSEGTDAGWGSPLVIGLLVTGACALAGFVYVELKHHDPMLQLLLFAKPMFTLAMFMTFVTQFCFFGSNFLLPLFLQTAHGLGAAETGLILFPSAILDFVAINISGRLYNTMGPRPFAIAGLVALTGTALALSRATATTSPLEIAIVASFRGAGMGLCMMPVMTMAYNTVPQALIPRATALQNVLQRIFGSAATAILTTILVVSLSRHGAPTGATITSAAVSVELVVKSFSDAFIAMSAVAALAIVVAFFMRDDVLKAHQAERQAASALEAEANV
jgi:EmrB/QacA subfamily drug resistance transporter